MEAGISDLNQTAKIMRYAPLGNLCGNPAIVFPVAYDSENLPIALQVMGRHWDERGLIRLAAAGEEMRKDALRKPSIHFDILAN